MKNKIKYCTHCGSPLPVNAIRCPNCGEEVVFSFGEKIKRFFKKHAVHIAAPIVAIALLAGGAGIGYYVGHEQTRQATKTGIQTGVSLSSSTSEPYGKTVYITPYGKKYHRSTCRHVQGKAIEKKLSEVEKSHEPCAVCKP